MKCFENYFEKNNYTISNIRVSYMRGMKCFIHEGHVLGRQYLVVRYYE